MSCTALTSNPGLPHLDFILQPWRKIGIKSGRGRPRFEVIQPNKADLFYSFDLSDLVISVQLVAGYELCDI